MDDRDPIPISALQHWCYCPRQCGPIHLEQAFEENVHTLRVRRARRESSDAVSPAPIGAGVD